MSHRPRVLVIDDDELVRRTVVRSLRGRCDVEQMATADEALERIRAGMKYDMIVLDLALASGMTSRAFCAELEAHHAVHAQRVIIHTGSAKSDEDVAFLQSRMPRVVQKPATPTALLAMLDMLVARFGMAA